MKIEKPQSGLIVPHEKTLPKAKQDRLHLLKKIQANISPIFAFFPDSSGSARKILAQESKKKPLFNAHMEKVKNSLYIIDAPRIIEKLKKILRTKKAFIADGHHRYETAWNYLQLVKKSKMNIGSAQYVLMFLCPLEDKGLVVFPAHRVVKKTDTITLPNVLARARKFFTVTQCNSHQDMLRAMNKKYRIAICSGKQFFVLRSKNLSAIFQSLKGHSHAYKKLDVVILHTALLTGIDPQHIRYIKSAEKTYSLSKNGKAISFFINAPTVEEIKRVSLAGETMPQKTTYFYPKLATGLVIHSFAQ